MGEQKRSCPRGGRWLPWLAATAAAACIDYPADPDPADFTYTLPRGVASQDGPNVDPAPGPQPPVSSAPLVAPVTSTNQTYLDRSSATTTNLLPGLNPALCLDVRNGRVSSGTQLDLYRCTSDYRVQGFIMLGGQLVIEGYADPGQFKLPSTQCVGLAKDAKEGSPPTLDTCATDVAQARTLRQLWRWEEGMLQLEDSSLCLSLSATTPAETAALALYACQKGNSVQQWAFANTTTNDATPPGWVTIGARLSLARNPGVCMDVRSGSLDDGTSIGIYQCHTSAPERLVLFKRQLMYGGHCVTAEAPSAGSELTLRGCDSGLVARQGWDMVGGQLRLAGTSPALCICTATPDSPAPQAVEPLKLRPCLSGNSLERDCGWTLGTLGGAR